MTRRFTIALTVSSLIHAGILCTVLVSVEEPSDRPHIRKPVPILVVDVPIMVPVTEHTNVDTIETKPTTVPKQRTAKFPPLTARPRAKDSSRPSKSPAPAQNIIATKTGEDGLVQANVGDVTEIGTSTGTGIGDGDGGASGDIDGGDGGGATGGTGDESGIDSGQDLKKAQMGYALQIRRLLETQGGLNRIARRLRLEGRVVLEFVIAENGDINAVGLAKSSERDRLDNEALKAAWSLKNLKPPPGGSLRILVPVIFSLL